MPRRLTRNRPTRNRPVQSRPAYVPPSTCNCTPVVNRACSLHRNATTAPKSAASPIRIAVGGLAAVQLLHPWRSMQTGLHRVHGDTVGRHLEREGLEERRDAGAGGVRQDEVGHRLTNRQRRDRHHPTPSLLPHRRHRRPCTSPRSPAGSRRGRPDTDRRVSSRSCPPADRRRSARGCRYRRAPRSPPR